MASGSVQREIPSIDRLLASDAGKSLIEQAGRDLAVAMYRDVSGDLRARLQRKPDDKPADIESWLHEQASVSIQTLLTPSLKAVLNLTGTVLHTNLGRAPLPESCIEAVVSVSRGASNLEFDLHKGSRGDRDDHIEDWLCRLTGAEAATVVNNNAAAVLLTLNSLASRRSVAVSRGELIEIGGSFRMPDIMKRAGCKLVEVGTTNRTHLKDYAEAVDEGVVAVMRVHTSNYKVEGFTSEVPDTELGKLAKDNDIIFINDLGSGALVDMTRFGLPTEATPAEALAEGADVVTFSGDKLLGGPQCGLIVGTRKSIERIRKNPMKRALRCDKMTLAALEAIFHLYADPHRLAETVPSLRILGRSADDIQELAQALQGQVQSALASCAEVSVESCNSQIGSGALPVDRLPSWALVLHPLASSGIKVAQLAAKFRELKVPVIGRIRDDALWFDLRCLEDADAFVSNLSTLKANAEC